ncbi:LysR family transcriptional regulator [Streptomyces platensis]|uniref:LysR family transcriptional regulator n=1 Tax=Streptomyces platensis TaxID=58346 RepID=UPI00332B4879
MASSGTETLLTVLPALAKALDSRPVPIDYDRRRQLFSPDSVGFDHHAYQTLCRRHGWRPHAPLRITWLRWHLAGLLLGADPGAASRTPAGHLAFRYRLHPDLHELLSPAMHAVSRTKNCIQRLRHLTVISRHRTFQDAAAELGVTWGTLNYQVKRIEETAGFTIIGTGRSRPLTITEAGRRFLDEATRLLALLDDHDNHHTGETQLLPPERR